MGILDVFSSKSKGNNPSQINEIIFRELIKRGYSLEGKTRVWWVADSRLWYLTPEQAQGFLDLEHSPEYTAKVTNRELSLIDEHIEEITKSLGKEPTNMIDVGCGDGKKAAKFLSKLKDKLKVRYCPVDISSYMVQKAIAEVQKIPDLGKVITLRWNISDFENLENISSLLRFKEFQKNFMLLLGNTLGNFEVHELLYILSRSMKDGDNVLIGSILDNKNSEELLKAYNTPQINNFLIHIPLKLGIPRDALEFGVRFRNSRIECYYTVNKNVSVSFLGKTIEFDQGDQIIASISYIHNKADLSKFLKMYFSDVKIFTNEDGSYALSLCKK